MKTLFTTIAFFATVQLHATVNTITSSTSAVELANALLEKSVQSDFREFSTFVEHVESVQTTVGHNRDTITLKGLKLIGGDVVCAEAALEISLNNTTPPPFSGIPFRPDYKSNLKKMWDHCGDLSPQGTIKQSAPTKI